MKKPHQSIRIFKNDYLERLTHVHPITPLLVWSPIVAFLLWRSFNVHQLDVIPVLGIGIFAFVFWTLAEYILHRWVFHLPVRGKITYWIYFLIHGNHHDDPNDPTRLVMPPAGSLILAAILFPMFRAVLGPAWVEPFFAFFVIGYLCYDYTHYAIHHFTPRTAFGKYNKKHHMLHHFGESDARWGVSSPFWDYVFGTALSPKLAERRAAAAANSRRTENPV